MKIEQDNIRMMLPRKGTQYCIERIWAWGGFVLGISAVILAAANWYETRIATVEANRAWLYTANLTVHGHLPHEPMQLTMWIQNGGREPATDVRWLKKPELFFVDKRADTHDVRIPASYACKTGDLGPGRVIYPGQTIPNVSIVGPSEDMLANIQAVVNDTKAMIIQDCITYVTFGQRHSTPVCRVVDKGSVSEGSNVQACENELKVN